MTTISGLLDCTDLRFPDKDPIPTRVAALDEVTGGGLRPGRLWLLTGAPGSGRSAVAAQVLRAAGAAGLTGCLVSVRDDEPAVATRVLSAAAGVPLHRLRTGRCSDTDMDRLAVAREDLRQQALRVEAARPGTDVPDLDALFCAPVPDAVLIVDDVDLWQPGGHVTVILRRLRAHARVTGTHVLITAPAESVLCHGQPAGSWARLCDDVVEITRPDLSGPGRDSGVVELRTLARGGAWMATPLTVRCGYQAHFARLADLPAGEQVPDARDELAGAR